MLYSNYFDTRSLRDLVDLLKEGRTTARMLRDSVSCIKSLSDPSLIAQYNRSLYMADSLVQYFIRMIDAMEQTTDETIMTQQRIEVTIQEATGELEKANQAINI